MSLHDYQRAISSQAESGLTFGQIEDFIEACSLDEEQKSALWLWAWAHQPPETMRRLADAHVLRLSLAETVNVDG